MVKTSLQFIIIIILLSTQVFGQHFPLSFDVTNHIQRDEYLFNEAVYAGTLAEMKLNTWGETDIITQEIIFFNENTEYITAFSYFQTHPIEGLDRLKEISINSEDIQARNLANLSIGDFYFNKRKYEESFSHYTKVEDKFLKPEKIAQKYFRLGYTKFVTKAFVESLYYFKKTTNISNSTYKKPAEYYLGMSYFFSNDLEAALNSFLLLRNAPAYKSKVPSYISQIYFVENKYYELIAYAEPLIKQKIDNLTLINQLLGQVYFIKENYSKALGYLEYYEQHTNKLTKEEFYQLALTQYKEKKYEQAQSNFSEIATIDSELGQNTSFYLADCQLKLNDKTSALNNFYRVSKMYYNAYLTLEGTYNYGLLSAELGHDEEAISALSVLPENFAKYTKSQEVLADVLIGSSNYKKAIEVLSGMSTRSPNLEKAYQKLNYNEGVSLYANEKLKSSYAFFEISEKSGANYKIALQSIYWQAAIAYQEEDYELSKTKFEEFVQNANNTQLPSENSSALAYYNLGYIAMKQDNYTLAINNFDKSLQNFARNKAIYSDPYYKNEIFGDALLRSADCYFKLRDYENAETRYKKTYDHFKIKPAYALYQIALIKGLQGDEYDKVLVLEDFLAEHGTSDYGDDALLELGNSYIRLNDLSQSNAAFKRLVKTYKEKSNLINQAYLKIGLNSYNSGDMEEALIFYKSVVSNNPTASESQEALEAIKEIYVRDLAQSQSYFEYIALIPGMEISSFEMDSLSFYSAKLKYENGDIGKANETLNIYLENYPTGYYHLNAHYLRGESLLAQKAYTQSLKDYIFIINKGSSKYYEDALFKAAEICYNNEKDFSAALSYYAALANSNANKERVFDAVKGGLHSSIRLENKEGIIEYSNRLINQSLATQDDKGLANYWLGKSYLSVNNNATAKIHFNKVANFLDNEYAIESAYQIAYITYQEGDILKAQEIAQKAYVESTNYPYWVGKNVLLLADTYIKSREFLNAQAALEAIIEKYKIEDDVRAEAIRKLEKVNTYIQNESRVIDRNALDTLQMDN